MEYGIQMYSLRDITKDDLEGAFKAVAEMGYKTVETAGFFGHSAKEVLGMIEKNGLRLVGTHSGWEELADNFDETVRFHKELGNKRYHPRREFHSARQSRTVYRIRKLCFPETESRRHRSRIP